VSGPGDDTGEDQSGGTGSGDATQRLPSQPGTTGDATQRLPSQPGGASPPSTDPDADLKHSKLVGYMSVPVHRLLPIRRSTLLMIVAFVGFGILLHTYPPQSANATSAGTFIKGSDGQEYFVPSATKVSIPTTTTTTTSTTTPDRVPPTTTATTVPHSSTTTTYPHSQTTTTVAPSTTTTTAGSSGTTTTTALRGTSSTTVP
jgi:hypothetical protein